ncbi:MAG: class I SAM-dependent methyltransferase [Ktedonobacteraceae bacterium]|nr:class I SAM-dependent methyltransferase [Ktedonobacteraceae bacterium]
MATPDGASDANKYVIDIESGAETARLVEQDKLLTRAMGGLFPEQPDLPSGKRVLDVACGPGGWAIEVAFTYSPQVEVVGIDLNQTMIEYARAVAWSRGLNNVTFTVMDAKQPLAFEEHSFDIVNARFIFSFMDQAAWPALLAECQRVLRPGGLIRLTEFDTVVSNSASWQRIQEYLYQAMARQRRTFSVDKRSVGVVHMLKKLLQDAGFDQVERRPFIIDSSYGADLHHISCKDAEVGFALVKPYLIKSGVAEETTYDATYQQMLIDMLGEDFISLGFGVTTWAIKPGEEVLR